MISRGIVYGGIVLPGSERVIRDSEATWTKGRETRPRAGTIDLLTGHWTAGPHREGPKAGLLLFKAMEARKSADGSRDLSVSVHFGISWDGAIWQYLDLAEAAVHVGLRPVIARSVGFEIMWCGTSTQARKLGIQCSPKRMLWGPHSVDVCPLSDEARDAMVWLCEYLSSDAVRKATNGAIDIPRKVAPTRQLTQPEMRHLKGFCEHASLPATEKIDTAGACIDVLKGRGWKT